MWESILLDLLRIYLPAIVFAVICGVSILHFRRTKEKGYLAISMGLVILTIGWLLLRIVALYLTMIIDLGNSYWIIGLYATYAGFYLVPALLILIGFIYNYKESKQKSLKQTDT